MPQDNFEFEDFVRFQEELRQAGKIKKTQPLPVEKKKDTNTQIIDLFHIPNTKGDVGIEIELEAENRFPREVKSWDLHQEGSLRGNAAEYATIGAVYVHKVYDLVAKLRSDLHQFKTRIKKSNRTSTHIHLNVQKEKVIDVCGILVIAAVIEPLLLRVCGSDRDGNLFCLPSYETGDLPFFVEGLLKYVLTQKNWLERDKYAAISTASLSRFGTVEFRCFPSSISPDEVYLWSRLVYNIREKARQSQDKTFLSVIDKAYNNPKEFAKELFEGISLKGHDIQTLIHFGCKTGYEISRAIRNVEEKNA